MRTEGLKGDLAGGMLSRRMLCLLGFGLWQSFDGKGRFGEERRKDDVSRFENVLTSHVNIDFEGLIETRMFLCISCVRLDYIPNYSHITVSNPWLSYTKLPARYQAQSSEAWIKASTTAHPLLHTLFSSLPSYSSEPLRLSFSHNVYSFQGVSKLSCSQQI